MGWWIGDFKFPKAENEQLITLDEYMEGVDFL
jgi:hypothetical protein